MFEYEAAIEAIRGYYGEATYWRVVSHQTSVYDFYKLLEQMPDVEVIKNANGTYRAYHVKTPIEIETGYSAVSEINSNISTTKTTTVDIPLNTTVDSQTGNVIVEQGAKTTVAGATAVATVAKPRNWTIPLIAVGTLITLGKLTMPELYQEHPEFFGDVSLGIVDPTTWDDITYEKQSRRVFDGFIKIDSDNSSQAYVEDKAIAYMIKYFIEQGVFTTGREEVTETELDNYDLSDNLEYPIEILNPGETVQFKTKLGGTTTYFAFKTDGSAKMCLIKDLPQAQSDPIRLLTASADNSANYIYRGISQTHYIEPTDLRTLSNRQYTYDNKTVHYGYQDIVSGTIEEIDKPTTDVTTAPASFDEVFKRLAWLMVYGYEPGGGGVEGIESEDGATTPNFTADDDYDDILDKLDETYPGLSDKAVTQDVVQPDGTVKRYRYLPIVLPEPNDNPTEGKSPLDEPIAGEQGQEDEDIDPDNEPIIEYVYPDIVSPRDENMENTGGGTTPPVVIPPGSAEALYKIYNPDESEINDFGAWLWSANFVDQLLKMFNDPMQAIISLHKVFCTPSIGGTANIKVGYLDSGVSSNVVDEQYVTINCGTVSLSETYQSVFDYPPYTEVSLYLPFIGIVRLDTNDVMRSSITVTYHIDVLTGSCLAEVSVIRDTFGGVLYQYAGDCSVHYPLSSGSYMGIVGALLGVAGTVASGGALAPMALGVASGVMGARSSVERSGGFSGNAGAMGSKKPYLIIQRPQTNMATDFNKFVGKPANETVKISECTGFISCTEVHALNTICTESEMNELLSLLKTGILI